MDKRQIALKIIQWSESQEPEAVRQAETYRALRPKPLTNAQLNSLQGMVEAAPDYSAVRDYIQNQADKAGRAGPGQAEMRNFWLDLFKTLGELQNEAEEILAGFVDLDAMTKGEKRGKVDDLHRRLAREYVQHLVAHCLYVTARPEGG